MGDLETTERRSDGDHTNRRSAGSQSDESLVLSNKKHHFFRRATVRIALVHRFAGPLHFRGVQPAYPYLCPRGKFPPRNHSCPRIQRFLACATPPRIVRLVRFGCEERKPFLEKA